MHHTTTTKTMPQETKPNPLFPCITTFGLGYCKPFSGTWGSLPTAALAAGMILWGFTPETSPTLYNTVLAFVLFGFTWACVSLGKAAEETFGKKDPSEVVADETAGQAIPLMFLPVHVTDTVQGQLLLVLGAFVAFRFFDILKLPPANNIQQVGGGWGIVLDDLIAGVQALVMLHLVVIAVEMWT